MKAPLISSQNEIQPAKKLHWFFVVLIIGGVLLASMQFVLAVPKWVSFAGLTFGGLGAYLVFDVLLSFLFRKTIARLPFVFIWFGYLIVAALLVYGYIVLK